MLCLMSPEARVPAEHPLRRSRSWRTRRSSELSPVFDAMYAATGRPSIPPERLLKASLLMALYTVRSERLFCEQLDYNLLFRWFLDMDMVEPSFDPTVVHEEPRAAARARRRGRVLRARSSRRRATRELMSNEHFTVDGTLIEAWASLKSFKPKDERRRQRAARRSGQPDGELPRREAQQRDARVDDGPRGAARAQGQRQGGEAVATRRTR